MLIFKNDTSYATDELRTISNECQKCLKEGLINDTLCKCSICPLNNRHIALREHFDALQDYYDEIIMW